MKILKFGGTSVANSDNIKLVKDITANQPKGKTIIVVSALGGVTDLLLTALDLASKQDISYEDYLNQIEDRHLKTAKELFSVQHQSKILSEIKSKLNELETLMEGAYLIGEHTAKLSDKVVSYGELLSSFIISEYFKQEGLEAALKSGRELIITNDNFGNAVVDFELTNTQCANFFKNDTNALTVVPGFVSSSRSGGATTLGRGGSDYTAAILAAATDAEALEIWTDVSGMFTANPKLVKQAKAIEHISYEEAMELSHFGAKVLYPPTVQPVLKKEIPISIKNTFQPEKAGTLITKSLAPEARTVRGISHIDAISLVSLEGAGMVGISGISKRLFETLSQENINVVLITQASSEHSICIGIAAKDAKVAASSLNKAFAYEISTNAIQPVKVEDGLAIIALIGDSMKNHQGLSGKMFSTLGKNNVNIRAIAQGASERNISAVINALDVKKALNTLHETFFEENIKQLNLFVMGVGNVGAKFLSQLRHQKEYLRKELKINVRVIGISNSRKMLFQENGILLDHWDKALQEGQAADLEKFIFGVNQLNLRNSIFVDITANETVAQSYGRYLSKSVSVVTCNKIACSSDYDSYKKLKDLAKEYHAPFLFETNVGAGLPILDTLKHLIISGDKVTKIQAVLSGSLNYVFNNFDQNTTFAAVVKKAQVEGYTEPDPKIDLSGIDVMRKILILIRESGYRMELSDIANKSFLSQESLSTKNNKDFFETLVAEEAQFQKLYKEASENNCKLKYVAEFNDGKASVGLQHIPKGHDFYHLEGSDNIVLFFTQRYPVQPLIIKGAGAGADVTASGIFADIIRIANF